MDKSFAVFGLGKFGSSVVTELANAGADVLAIDIDRERVHALADIATCAVAVDICDTEAMESLGISNMDAVVVAITESLDISILATIFAKEAGVPYIIAKSRDATHTKILQKIGADKIVQPELEAGVRIARHLATGNILDFVELSDTIEMIEINIRNEWIGHTLRELNLREREHINVIALRKNEELIITPPPDNALEEGLSMLVIVEKKYLHKLVQ